MVELIEYGIDQKCPDCIGMMAHFLDTGFNGTIDIDRMLAYQLAGESAEAGSIYGWFVLAGLLRWNSLNKDRFDDGIDVYESDMGVRKYIPWYDEDTSVSKVKQLSIAIEIYYSILNENHQSHPICVETAKKLVRIYKHRERLFNMTIEATDQEIRRLEEI